MVLYFVPKIKEQQPIQGQPETIGETMDFQVELVRLAEFEADYQKKVAVFREVWDRQKQNPVLTEECFRAWHEVAAVSKVTFELAQHLLLHAQKAVQDFIISQGFDGVLAGAVVRRDFAETFNLDRK